MLSFNANVTLNVVLENEMVYQADFGPDAGAHMSRILLFS